ncbi:MAG TPA: hypothetical protein PL096_04135 [Micropepsaceae bacterium]|nr:hypothetical protein [Micropepsaceae bacterium]
MTKPPANPAPLRPDSLRVGLTYDLRKDWLAMGYGEEETAEFDSEATPDGLERVLTGLGFHVERIGHIRNLTRALADGKSWDFVFNICEGMHGLGREAQVPGLLDAYNIPYVFSDPLTLCITLDKGIAKTIVRERGVPTADFAVLRDAVEARNVPLPFPLFVKPVAEGSGKGVSARSRVTNHAELEAEAARLIAKFHQPVLVETFLSGREFTVGIVGEGANACALGVMEVHFGEKAAAFGYGYENKQDWEGKISYTIADDGEARVAADVALKAWAALRCRDGGRIDIRSDHLGQPHFIEVNPLAGLHPDYSDLVFLARDIGMTYPELITRIVKAFLARHPALQARAGLP